VVLCRAAVKPFEIVCSGPRVPLPDPGRLARVRAFVVLFPRGALEVPGATTGQRVRVQHTHVYSPTHWRRLSLHCGLEHALATHTQSTSLASNDRGRILVVERNLERCFPGRAHVLSWALPEGGQIFLVLTRGQHGSGVLRVDFLAVTCPMLSVRCWGVKLSMWMKKAQITTTTSTTTTTTTTTTTRDVSRLP